MPICETCAQPLTRAKTGRPRRYCSDVCRKRAFVERNSYVLPSELADPVDSSALRAWTAQALVAEMDGEAPADPVERLTRAVGETETLAVEYKRLARTTPKNLAWRASDMADSLRAELDRLFPREDRA